MPSAPASRCRSGGRWRDWPPKGVTFGLRRGRPRRHAPWNRRLSNAGAPAGAQEDAGVAPDREGPLNRSGAGARPWRRRALARARSSLAQAATPSSTRARSSARRPPVRNRQWPTDAAATCAVHHGRELMAPRITTSSIYTSQHALKTHISSTYKSTRTDSTQVGYATKRATSRTMLTATSSTSSCA